MSIIKLHPKFILRVESDAAYGIQSDNQEKIKITDQGDVFCLYLASLGRYSFTHSRLKEWEAKKIIIKEKGKGEKFKNEKEKTSFQKLIYSKPSNYTQFPLMLTLGITNKCIFFCRHCGNNSGPKSDVAIGLKKIKEIIDECGRMGVLKLTLTGGEPFVRDDIFEIISYAKEKIPRVGVTSNGALISKDVAQKLADCDISLVKISLDGLKNFHDKYRSYSGAYESACLAIKYLKARNIEVRVQSTLCKKNKNDLLKLLAITGGLGVDVYTIVPLSPIGRASVEDMLSPIEFRAFIERFVGQVKNLTYKTVYQIRPVFDLNINLELKTLSIKYKCEALKNTIEIQANGDIIPCSFFNLKLGNIYQDKLREVWHNQKTNKVRNYFHPDNLKGACHTCMAKDKCGGGCLANSFSLYQKPYLRDIYCWRNLCTKK